MVLRFSNWLQRRLVSRHRGHDYPPGGGPGKRWRQRDRVQLSVFSHGDALEVVSGRDEFHPISLEPRTLVSFAFWVLWWWAWHQWFGLRLSLWRWTLRVMLDGQDHSKPSRD